MEEAFRRAQLYIDAIRGCSIHASIATVKSYATQLEKELEIIKKEVQKLKEPRIPVGSFDKEPRKGWGNSDTTLQEWEAQFNKSTKK